MFIAVVGAISVVSHALSFSLTHVERMLRKSQKALMQDVELGACDA
jgi:hypothetical protein